MVQYDVLWNSPSKNSYGSMPIGNGDIGLNVWVEEDGDLLFYISKTDAWSENARLLKFGRVRVSLTPNPFAKGAPFEQRLCLQTGEITILAGEYDNQVTLRVWVDANNPVIHVDAESPSAFELQVNLEIWRTERRQITDEVEIESAYGLHGDNPNPVIVEPDMVVSEQRNRIIWYHRNERSTWADNLKHTDLGDLTATLKDPLLHQTFGAAIKGEGLVSASETSLRCSKPSDCFQVAIYPLTKQTDTAQQWLDDLERQMARIDSIPKEDVLANHRDWWKRFWDRSWICMSGSGIPFLVVQGYALQRFINACGGRGGYPIKFNGSIFTVDGWPGRPKADGKVCDPDYRQWGGPYWFQNTRLLYWSMIHSGDFDLMLPLFKMFREALPLAKARTRIYYNHDGAFFPETMYFWGTYVNANYGWNRAGKPIGLTDNRYIHYYWQGGIELCMMMLDYLEHTQDYEFATSTMLPIASEVLTFFDQHWKRDEQGKIRFDPAMALETYQKAVNPMAEIAGLRQVITRLLALPEDMTTEVQRAAWQNTLSDLPDLPSQTVNGGKRLSPAETYSIHQNSENPELYAIFPYRLFGVGKDGLELALRTFTHRNRQATGGWQQDAIQAAMLGLAEHAAVCVAENFTTKDKYSRFPAFWGPNFDYVPDQDHGGVAMTALQFMLMQTDGKKIILFPAWPADWDVKFKLHAPFNTTVEASYRAGKVELLKVTPESRAEDVVCMEPQ